MNILNHQIIGPFYLHHKRDLAISKQQPEFFVYVFWCVKFVILQCMIYFPNKFKLDFVYHMIKLIAISNKMIASIFLYICLY